MLGTPISLHYDKSTEFKAVTGGIWSIILYSIMGYVLVYLSIRVFQGTSIEISESVVDSNIVFTNQSVSPFEGTKFNIAMRLSIPSMKDPEWVVENMDYDFYQTEMLVDENNNQDYDATINSLEKCDDSHFPKNTFNYIPALNYSRWIPSNFTIKGSRHSRIHKNIQYSLSYKSNSSCPLTYEEFINRTRTFRMNLIISNEYFDPYNKDDPIHTIINDQYYVAFSADRYVDYHMFIEKNTYEIESGGFFSGKKSGEFFRASKDK